MSKKRKEVKKMVNNEEKKNEVQEVKKEETPQETPAEVKNDQTPDAAPEQEPEPEEAAKKPFLSGKMKKAVAIGAGALAGIVFVGKMVLDHFRKDEDVSYDEDDLDDESEEDIEDDGSEESDE